MFFVAFFFVAASSPISNSFNRRKYSLSLYQLRGIPGLPLPLLGQD